MEEYISNQEIQKVTFEIRDTLVAETPEVFEEDSVKHLEYLKEIFIKSCIKALQSKVIGAWVHLLEVLTLIKPFCDILLKSEQIFHYLVRIHDFCQHHDELKHLNVLSRLAEIFPNVDFNVAVTTSISTLNSQSPMQLSTSNVKKVNNSLFNVIGNPYLKDNHSVFKINSYDLQGRIYEPKQLSVIDIQRFLPRVVSDIARLEATWDNALGLTVTSLNTDIPQDILDQRSPSPSFSTTTLSDAFTEERRDTILLQKKELKTGREVIESLVKAGKQKDVQIFYLNLAPSVIYNPYDLVLASKSTIKKEHVVMSIFGVLHVRQNGNSDLTPLGQWYMEAVCFETMKNISFFRNFYLIKSFKKWKDHLRYSKFLCTRKRILSCHLYSIPSVPHVMFKINHLAMQMDGIKIFPSCDEGKIKITEIESIIFSQLHIGGKTIQRLFTLTLSILSKCHEDCINYLKYCQDQLDVDIQSQESLAISRKRKENQLKNKKTAENNLMRFPTIIQLTTCMISSQLIWKISRSISQFIHEEVLGNPKGYFYCALQILDSELSIEPSEAHFHSILSKTISNCLVRLESKYFKSLSTVIEMNKETSQESNCSNPRCGMDVLKSILEVKQANMMEKELGTEESKDDFKMNTDSKRISIKGFILEQ